MPNLNIGLIRKEVFFVCLFFLIRSLCLFLAAPLLVPLLWCTVCEVVQTLQLSADRDQADVVGDLCVCLDGMQVDPQTFAAEEQSRGEPPSLRTL